MKAGGGLDWGGLGTWDLGDRAQMLEPQSTLELLSYNYQRHLSRGGFMVNNQQISDVD